jgi:hypothetical protein
MAIPLYCVVKETSSCVCGIRRWNAIGYRGKSVFYLAPDHQAWAIVMRFLSVFVDGIITAEQGPQVLSISPR